MNKNASDVIKPELNQTIGALQTWYPQAVGFIYGIFRCYKNYMMTIYVKIQKNVGKKKLSGD